MTYERAKRLATQWANGRVCTVRDGEAEEYHKLVLELLQEREKRNKGCPYCSDKEVYLDELSVCLNMNMDDIALCCYHCGRVLKGANN